MKKVVFVHGLGGNAKKTWGHLPELIRKDDELGTKYELIFYKFNTSLLGFRLAKGT